jgi:hypothetical protein
MTLNILAANLAQLMIYQMPKILSRAKGLPFGIAGRHITADSLLTFLIQDDA